MTPPTTLDGRPARRIPAAGPARRIAAEVIGTFFLTAAAVGADVVADLYPGKVSTAQRALAPALVVAAMIYAFGSTSGAHFNPAVTTGFALRGVFPWRWVPPYVAAQLVGSALAAGTARWILHPTVGAKGTNSPHGSDGQSLAMEILLTCLLVIVILGSATEHRLLGPHAAVPTAATIAAAGFVGLPVSGASMNPARSTGPAMVAWTGVHLWIYVVGPLAGALLAVVITRLVAGPPQDEESGAAEGDDNR
jgi:aquaporin Z